MTKKNNKQFVNMFENFTIEDLIKLKKGLDDYNNKSNELILITAPRTEADIINDLKALGWRYQPQRLSYEYHFYKYGGYHIEIKGGDKVIAYEEGHEDWSCGEYEMHKPIFIPYDVYKLIFELLNLEE